MPRSAEPARREILDASLRLFASNRISAVSLRQIGLEAHQRNTGVIQYHFGSLDGLLRALLERELPLLLGPRLRLLEAARADRSGSAWSVAAVWALPYGELATGTERQRFVIRFLSQLHDDVTYSLEDIRKLMDDPTVDEARALLRQRVPPSIPDDLLDERIRIATNSFVHAAAIRAGGRPSAISDARFRVNLVDMFLASLAIPPTEGAC